MHELVIIGAGPAGITAGIYAARKKMDFLVITKDIGGQTIWSGEVENYTGYQIISGPELAAKFEEHMRVNKIPVKEGEEVIDISKDDDTVVIRTDKGTYTSEAAIVASGKKSKELGVPGEKELRNRGLTYCATCDGPLFAGKDVAVVGGGNSALDAALQLVKIARRVFVITVEAGLTGDPVMLEKLKTSSKVSLYYDTRVLTIQGDTMVKGIALRRGLKDEKIAVQGVFVEIGLVPNSSFAKGLRKNALGEIEVDCFNQTSSTGIFAAGDVTTVPEKQIIVAAGEGAKAALGVFKYLNGKQKR